MFLTHAHSFRQQAKLAITLAWIAGYTNIVALLTCGHVTSHMSGTTSDLGRGIAEGRWGLVLFVGYLLVVFTIGAMISGVMTEFGRRRLWESIYVMPMAFEAVLLALFAAALVTHDVGKVEIGWRLFALAGLASMAMGIQNATITRISSGVVRTTHVTGVVTDLGLELVALGTALFDRWRAGAPTARHLESATRQSTMAAAAVLAREPVTKRVLLLSTVIVSFGLGALLGTLGYLRLTDWCMFPPVLFLIWIVYQDVKRPIAEIEPSDLVVRTALDLPEQVVVYQVADPPVQGGRAVGQRIGRHYQRLPDMGQWILRLPASAKVLVLDLSNVEALGEEAPRELRRACELLHAQGRHLVLSGVTAEDVGKLRSAGLGEALGQGSTTLDLSEAVAIAKRLADLGSARVDAR